MSADQTFTVGRVALVNGPRNTPFPAQIRQAGNGRLSISGTYHPEQVSDTVADRQVLGRAFIQQWCGLEDEPDAIPIVSERAPQLSGIYRVRSTSIDWTKLTDPAGTVTYTGEFERISGHTSAVSEVQFAVGVRSTFEHAVTPEPGFMWIPVNRLSQTLAVAGPFSRTTGSDYDLTMLPLYYPESGVAQVGSFQFGQTLEGFYDGACKVEIRYRVDGVASGWVPVVGTNIPATSPQDLRISNDVIRVSYYASDVDGSSIVSLDRAYRPGTIGLVYWTNVSTHVMNVTAGSVNSDFGPVGTPSIIRNSPENVTVRYTPPANSGESAPVTVSLNRGDTFAAWSGTLKYVALTGLAGQTLTSTTGGFYSSPLTTAPAEQAFVVASPLDLSFSTSTMFAVYAAGDIVPMSWALGVWDPTPSPTQDERTDPDELIAQYWMAASQTQRFVAL